MSGGNLSKRKDVESVLAAAVGQVATERAHLGKCDAALDRWKAIFAGARAMAEHLGCDPDERQTARQRRAQEPLLDLPAVSAANVPVDFTSKKAALDSLAHAAHVCDSASKLVTDASEAIKAGAARVQALVQLVVAAGTVTAAEAERIVSNAAKKGDLSVELLADGTKPLRERPIVEIAAHLLQREGRPLRTHELIAFMSDIGHPIAGSNPSGTVRSSILARRNKSPVVQAGPGLWRLRDWPDDAGEGR